MKTDKRNKNSHFHGNCLGAINNFYIFSIRVNTVSRRCWRRRRRSRWHISDSASIISLGDRNLFTSLLSLPLSRVYFASLCIVLSIWFRHLCSRLPHRYTHKKAIAIQQRKIILLLCLVNDVVLGALKMIRSVYVAAFFFHSSFAFNCRRF